MALHSFDDFSEISKGVAIKGNQNETELEILRVEAMMTADVLCIGVDQTVREAIDLLVKNEIGGAPVVDQLHRLIAVVSGGDLLRIAATEGMDKRIAACLKNLKTGSNLVTLNKFDSFKKVYRMFVENSVHRIVVVDASGTIQGIVSRTNVLRILTEFDVA